MTHSRCLFEPWLNFKTPIVRQLAFCIASPNIIRTLPPELDLTFPFELHHDVFWQNCYVNYQARLFELDEQPQPLIDFLAQIKSTRLGIRFETLLCFWLQDNPDEKYHPYRLIRHSLQQIDGAKTLGELDFLLLNTQTQEIEHWEVALKFYLAEQQYQLPFWYGLNRDDTLEKKLQHFTRKQFQFSAVLGHTIQKKYAVIKGQLYLPQPQYFPIPYWVNQNRRLGIWSSKIPQQPMYHLSRHEWISPDYPLRNSTPTTWWRNDLYCDKQQTIFYMFRKPSLLLINKNRSQNKLHFFTF